MVSINSIAINLFSLSVLIIRFLIVPQTSLFFLQNSFSFPPEEKQIILQPSFFADSTTVSVSIVFPETLVAITRVRELTVDGNSYPFTIVT